MKSWTNTVLALALLSTLSLAGCGTNEKTSENENQASSNTVETKEHKDTAKQAVQSNESNQESENQNTASSENKQSEQESAKANDSSNNQTEKRFQPMTAFNLRIAHNPKTVHNLEPSAHSRKNSIFHRRTKQNRYSCIGRKRQPRVFHVCSSPL